MVICTEAAGVHSLGSKIRRIKIEESIVAVIMPHKSFKILILHNDICHALFKPLY